MRSGAPQYHDGQGRETNVLIQPEGQTWRALRNSMVSVYRRMGAGHRGRSPIAAFYLWKGTMPLHEPPTGRKIRRFTNWQMAIHWTTAWTFVTLAITGLILTFGKNILLPLIGYTLFSWLAIFGKNLHNFLGPLFLVLRRAAVLHVRPRQRLAPVRLELAAPSRRPRIRAGRPSGKFNAGEKLWFWGGVLRPASSSRRADWCSTFPISTRHETRCRSPTSCICRSRRCSCSRHSVTSTWARSGMAGAYDAMSKGYVDETWAKEHHLYWYNDIRAGKIPTAPDDVPAPAPTPRTA